MSKDVARPTITLKNGAVVDAREAVFVLQQLRATLEANPDEFRSLLALAEGRIADADPRHFRSLNADDFLEEDGRTISPSVRDVLLNSYEITHEGAVIVPLRLQNEADLVIAKTAQERLDQQLRNSLFGDQGKGWSRD